MERAADRRRLEALFRPLLAVLFLGFLVSACGPTDPSSSKDLRPTLAASVPPHAWLVEQVAGAQAAEVVTFVPPGASPHSHLPTDAEISRLARSRIFFRSGVPIENGPWLDALRSTGLGIVDLRHDPALLEPEPEHEHQPHADPHTWLSPRQLRRQARVVEQALVTLWPREAEALAARRARLDAELAHLDAELRERLSPFAGREFFVYHPSWAYFADEYDLVQVAVEQGGASPSDAELTALRRRVTTSGARVLFVDPRNAGSGARALADTLGLELRRLDPLEADVPRLLRHAAGELIRGWESQS